MALTQSPDKLESVWIQRNAANQYYEQINVSGSDLIIYHSSSGELQADKISVWAEKYAIGGTGGTTVKVSSNDTTAGFLSGSKLLPGNNISFSVVSPGGNEALKINALVPDVSIYLSSSWTVSTTSYFAGTSSFAISASYCLSGSHFDYIYYNVTESSLFITNSISSSWASRSLNCITASYAFVAENLNRISSSNNTTLIVGNNLEPELGAIIDLGSSGQPFNSLTTTTIYTPTLYVDEIAANNFSFIDVLDPIHGTLIGTASYALNSRTASYALNSESASYWDSSSIIDILNNKQWTIETGSFLPITVSWANVSINSFVSNVSYTSLYASQSQRAVSASWASSSISTSYILGQNVDGQVTYSMFAITASYYNQRWLNTGSSYPITSSWSNRSITSSYSLTASYIGDGTNGFVPVWQSNRLSPTSSITATGTTVGINKTNPQYTIDASGSAFAFGATHTGSSFRLVGEYQNAGDTFLDNDIELIFHSNTRDRIKIVADQISAGSDDYDLRFDFVKADLSGYNTWMYIDGQTGGTGIGTNAPQAKLHVFGAVSASCFGTGSLQGTASNARSSSYAVTASYAPNAGTASYWNSSSIITLIGTKQNIIATGSLVPVTSSWANTASISIISYTGFYASQSQWAVSSSWSSASISASYANTASFWNSSSIVSLINTKQDILVTGNTYSITSSWSNKSISSSYSDKAINALFASQSFWAVSASWASRSLSSSWADSANPVFVGKTDGYYPKWLSNTLTGTSLISDVSNELTFRGPWRITSGSSDALSTHPELFGAWESQYGGGWARGMGWVSGSKVLAMIGGLGNASTGIFDYIYFGSGSNVYNTPWMVISSSGNVGINTTNPQTTLHVFGAISASCFGTGSLQGTASNAISSSYAVTASYAPNAGTASYWNSSSIVSLIGTKQDILVTGNTYSITSSWSNKSITASYSLTASYFGDGTNGYVPVWQNNRLSPTSSITATSTLVGINKINPQYTVDASGSSFAFGATHTGSSFRLVGEYQNTGDTFTDNDIELIFHSNTRDRIKIVADQISEGSDDYDLRFDFINADITGYNTWMYIDGPTGNVGIGTNTPQSKLHVFGAVSASCFGTGSLQGTASNAISSSYAVTASYAPFAGTSSYWDSSSVVNLINTKQNIIGTGSLLPVTASWAISCSFVHTALSALSASWASRSLCSERSEINVIENDSDYNMIFVSGALGCNTIYRDTASHFTYNPGRNLLYLDGNILTTGGITGSIYTNSVRMDTTIQFTKSGTNLFVPVVVNGNQYYLQLFQ